jgi:hypothetical protein
MALALLQEPELGGGHHAGRILTSGQPHVKRFKRLDDYVRAGRAYCLLISETLPRVELGP